MTTLLIVLCALMLALTAYTAFKIGVNVGEQSIINRLLDSKDTESWNQAHYVRADMRESRRMRSQG